MRHDRWVAGTNGALKRFMLNHSLGWADAGVSHVAAQKHRSCRAVEKLRAVCTHQTPVVMVEVALTEARRSSSRLSAPRRAC